MTEHQIQPVIEVAYAVVRRFSKDKRRQIFTDLRENNMQALYELLPVPHLQTVLIKEGFTPDENTLNSFCMRSDETGIDAYLMPQTIRSAVLRLRAPPLSSSFGIHPDYLDGLVKRLEGSDLRLREIEKTPFHNSPAPYDWNTLHGRAYLAGAQK